MVLVVIANYVQGKDEECGSLLWYGKRSCLQTATFLSSSVIECAVLIFIQLGNLYMHV